MMLSYYDGASVRITSRGLMGTATDAALLQVSDWGNNGPFGSNPPPFDYGVWGTAQDHTFTVVNTGAQAATGMSDAGSLGNGFAWKGGTYPGNGGNCGGTLNKAASCTVVVTYTPSGSGPQSSTMTIGYFDGHAGQTAVRSVTGTAVTQALLHIYDWQGMTQPLPQSPMDYGTWGFAMDHTFTVSNDGGAQATLMADGGGLGGGFAWKGGAYPGSGGTCATTLNKGAGCQIVVTYTPSGGVVQSSTVVLSYFDGAAAETASRAVMGTPTSHAFLTVSEFFGPNFCTNCGPYDFGTIATGTVAEAIFTVSNTGAMAASAVASTGSLALPFAFKGGTYPGTSGNCTTSLLAGQSCQLDIIFSPTTPGFSTSVVGVQFTDTSATPFTATRAVQGTGN
jgi:hypothetical protein